MTENGARVRATTRFRELLRAPGIIMAPGAYDCLTAVLAQQAGFPAVYMTGAGTSIAQIGYPDLAFATMGEMVANAAAITAVTDIPVIADADTGYGSTLNVRRTVRQYDRAGVAAIHIEDQEFPKRCGHLDNKRVAPMEEMVPKIRAAVDARTDDDFTLIVRTDALAVTGWDDTLRRCDAYVAAGADMLFVEALRSPEQALSLTQRFDLPLMYNFVETGKSPLLPVAELERLGFKLVIYPVSTLLATVRAVSDTLRELRQRGTTAHLLDSMATLHEAFETVGLSSFLELDARYAGG